MKFFLMLMLIGASMLFSKALQPFGPGYNRHCMCVKLESRVIPPDNLQSVEILPRGHHCKTTEVIAGLSSGEKICLNPRTPWVRKLINFIEKKERSNKKE
ncbi:interleukin-8-like [Triplophysa dalaica]|uniref:interleukin-8-like n=1 Tax=Triplophysa dalaica TaxID=1582913 RepID=UPI0024DF737B|nr:interleukin-8-like [Triplophysa dalaica]XP_056613434.1 interleukin-8-like [Triplophysa dalaica]